MTEGGIAAIAIGAFIAIVGTVIGLTIRDLHRHHKARRASERLNHFDD